MADPTQQQIQAWLTEARNALHLLILGRARVEVRQRDRAVVYSKAEINELRLYIAELEQMLDGAPAPAGRVFTMTQSGTGFE